MPNKYNRNNVCQRGNRLNTGFIMILIITIIFFITVINLDYVNAYLLFGRTGIPRQVEKKLTNHNNDNQFNGCLDDIRVNLTATRHQTCLIYNMVPKCGSEGMRHLYVKLSGHLKYTAIEGSYDFKSHLTAFHHKADVMKDVILQTSTKCADNRPNITVLYSHQHFSTFDVFTGEETPFYTNIIRDPVNHYISWYYYRRYGAVGRQFMPLAYRFKFYGHGSKRMSMTFDECVQNKDLECVHPSFTFNVIPFFCGYDYCLKPSQKSLAQAKENVVKYYPVVGYLENITMYLELCQAIWPQFFTGAVSLAKNADKTGVSEKRKKYEPTKLTKAKMAKRLVLEYNFYNWIKHRFHCMYDKYVKK